MRILVAEDRPKTADLLGRALGSEGHDVVLAYDGDRALSMGKNADADLILLDVMLPLMDGFTVLRKLRESRVRTPVIILTARDSKADIVHGLDCGADDYLTKPFELDILLARVRAVARRAPASALAELTYLDLHLNATTYEIRRGERTAPLTRTEYALLETLMRRPGAVVRRETLIEQGWGSEADATGASLYVFIRSLRSKITQPGETELLHTVRGVGYSLRSEPW
ncbi:MAG: response regulator transcription factor [Bryobacteraceae bacterium]|jgi:two-component system response regulator MprA